VHFDNTAVESVHHGSSKGAAHTPHKPSDYCEAVEYNVKSHSDKLTVTKYLKPSRIIELAIEQHLQARSLPPNPDAVALTRPHAQTRLHGLLRRVIRAVRKPTLKQRFALPLTPNSLSLDPNEIAFIQQYTRAALRDLIHQLINVLKKGTLSERLALLLNPVKVGARHYTLWKAANRLLRHDDELAAFFYAMLVRDDDCDVHGRCVQ
jgi:hypothetical protein